MPEDSAESALRDFVVRHVPLGIYNPLHPRRPRVPVADFVVEFFEVDEGVTHVAGPVTLRDESGEIERYLRVSVPWDGVGAIPPDAAVRAVYIEETDPETGACKETAALANE